MFGLGRTKKTEVTKEAETLGYVIPHACVYIADNGTSTAVNSKYVPEFQELSIHHLSPRNYLRRK